MAKTKKPTHQPSLPFPAIADALHQEGNWLWIPLRKDWRDVSTKPEEIVRQRFIRAMVEHYGYALEQMDQERRTQHGHKRQRADIVFWQSASDKDVGRTPVLVIECKTDTIEIQERDYYQGESYTRATGCEFFVATNARHTAVFKLVPGLPGGFVAINEIPKASDWGDAKSLKEIRESLRTFNRKEFQDLLFVCHSILRDVHKMDPGRAFDTISKILFIKMYVERSGLHGTFTTEYLDRRAASRMPNDPQVHDGLFDLTKDFYKADDLFTAADKLDISEETFRRIVKQLERFDLSKTGDDIKGLAFEKFLGTTFRGELGQFFTPRPVVEFMVDLLNPQEKQLICDPASGSGGFLIRAFEHVRAKIVSDVQRQKDDERNRIEALSLPEEQEERQIEDAFFRLNRELLPSGDDNKPIDTRVGRLAWQCIYGTDAEPRAARTAKMNMIMHGEALYDRDHCIGHAYFTALAQVPDGDVRFAALGQVFRNRIVPLLEEYFFEDWQKIRLVLGDNQKKDEQTHFIRESQDHEQDLNSLFGSDHGLDAYGTERRYSVQESAFSKPDAYIGIYQTLIS